jgi:Co/Zn/Cd efflux system component
MTMGMGTGMAMAIVIQMMTIPTIKKSMVMFITMSMATTVPLLSLPITTTIQALDSNMMLRNHCWSVNLIVRVLYQVPRLLRNLDPTSMYTVLICMCFWDSIQSISVVIGRAIIWYNLGWKIIDLICTLIFFVIVLFTTIRMLQNILELLMESTPREIDATRLERGLCEMDGVVVIHELHIWAITVGKVLLACHVTIDRDADADQILDKVIGYIRTVYLMQDAGDGTSGEPSM